MMAAVSVILLISPMGYEEEHAQSAEPTLDLGWGALLLWACFAQTPDRWQGSMDVFPSLLCHPLQSVNETV